MSCDHLIFEASVDVLRLTETEGGPVTGYAADIRVRCVDCGEHFTFLGPAGLSRAAPMVSVDGLELRAPIVPRAARLAFVDRIADARGRPAQGEA